MSMGALTDHKCHWEQQLLASEQTKGVNINPLPTPISTPGNQGSKKWSVLSKVTISRSAVKLMTIWLQGSFYFSKCRNNGSKNHNTTQHLVAWRTGDTAFTPPQWEFSCFSILVPLGFTLIRLSDGDLGRSDITYRYPNPPNSWILLLI